MFTTCCGGRVAEVKAVPDGKRLDKKWKKKKAEAYALQKKFQEVAAKAAALQEKLQTSTFTTVVDELELQEKYQEATSKAVALQVKLQSTAFMADEYARAIYACQKT